MRVLIVDDEAPARAKLRRMLGRFEDVEVVGEAADGAEALALAVSLAPDAMFLDLQMPEVGGFDVAASLPDGGPAIVFVTAHDQHALRAFDTDAADYLLKPVAPERLERALRRLRAARRVGAEVDAPGGVPSAVDVTSAAPSVADAASPAPPTRSAARAPAVPERLLVEDRGRTHVVQVREIEWLQAADNYVELHLPGRSLLMRRALAALLADLGPAFVRTHRGAAVALAAVQAVRPREKGDATVLLRGGAEVPCSRGHRAGLMAALQARAG